MLLAGVVLHVMPATGISSINTSRRRGGPGRGGLCYQPGWLSAVETVALNLAKRLGRYDPNQSDNCRRCGPSSGPENAVPGGIDRFAELRSR